jgi:hypothetical protein
MTTQLRAIDTPDLQPLRNSAEFDAFESEFKALVIKVFNDTLRPLERQVNVSGMPHLGNSELIERTLKGWGLAIVRRDATRTAFLLKAARARNPRRGLIFLRQYLQSVWPGVWKLEPLWHPIATANEYPAHRTPLTSVQVTPTVTVEFPDGNGELGTVFRDDWQGRQRLYATPRTNLHRYSEAIGSTGYTLSNTTLVAAARVGRTSDLTMSKLTVTATSTTGYGALATANRPAVAANTDYTWTCDVANGNAAVCALRFYSGDHQTNMGTVLLAFDAGGVPTVSSKSTSIKAVTITPGANGVFTVSITINTGAFTSVSPVYYPDNSYTAGNYTYFDKGQIEIGGAATSHIAVPAASPVTVTDYTLGANGLATFSDGVTPPTPITFFLTGRIRVTLPVSVDNGLGLLEITKAFRSTLAARLMLELQLSTVFEDIGQAGGLAIANGASAVMPFMAIGKLTR